MVAVPGGGYNLAKCIPKEERTSEEMLKHQIFTQARNSGGLNSEVTFQTGGSRHFQESSGAASNKRSSTKGKQLENQSYRETQWHNFSDRVYVIVWLLKSLLCIYL